METKTFMQSRCKWNVVILTNTLRPWRITKKSRRWRRLLLTPNPNRLPMRSHRYLSASSFPAYKYIREHVRSHAVSESDALCFGLQWDPMVHLHEVCIRFPIRFLNQKLRNHQNREHLTVGLRRCTNDADKYIHLLFRWEDQKRRHQEDAKKEPSWKFQTAVNCRRHRQNGPLAEFHWVMWWNSFTSIHIFGVIRPS